MIELVREIAKSSIVRGLGSALLKSTVTHKSLSFNATSVIASLSLSIAPEIAVFTSSTNLSDVACCSVELIAQSAQVLRELAHEDLSRIQCNDRSISIDALLKLSEARQALALRAWIEGFGLLPPSKAKLDEALRQTRLTHNDTKLAIKVGTNLEIRRYGAKLVMHETAGQKKDRTQFETLIWKGAGHYSLPAWGGELVISEVGKDEAGIAESFFIGRELQARPRQGGEKLKLYKNRPRKHLKDLYHVE